MDKGNLIISGSGKGYKDIRAWIKIGAYSAGVVTISFLLHYLTDRFSITMIVFCFIVVFCVILFFLQSLSAVKCNIFVYENIIEGEALPIKIRQLARTTSFHFKYEQITSVGEINNANVVITVQSEKYTIIVNNTKEIAEAINSRLQQLKSAE